MTGVARTDRSSLAVWAALATLLLVVALAWVVTATDLLIVFALPFAIAALAAFIARPDLAPYAIIAALPFTAYTIPHMPFNADLTVSDVIAWAALVGMALRAAGDRARPGFRIAADTPLLLAAVFMADGVLSLTQAADLRLGIVETIHYTEFFIGVYLIFSRLASDQRIQDRVLLLTLATGLIVSLEAAIQYLSSGSSVFRASGVFSNFNALGAYLSMVAAMAFALSATATTGGYRTFCLVTLGFTALGTVFTLSRGGVVSLIAGLVVVGVALGGRTLIGMLGVLILGLSALLLLAPGQILDRFGTILTGAPDDARPILWSDAWHTALANPLLGVGANNFHAYAPQTPGYIVYFNDPHNMFLKIASETGLPSLIVFLLYLFVVLSRLVRLARHMQGRECAVAAALLGGCTAFVMGGLFGSPIVRGHGMLFFALIGLATAVSRPARVANAEGPASQSGKELPTVLAVGAAGTQQ